MSASWLKTSTVIPGCALLGAGPESITPNRGYGFRVRAEEARPGMTTVGVGAALEPRPRVGVLDSRGCCEMRTAEGSPFGEIFRAAKIHRVVFQRLPCDV